MSRQLRSVSSCSDAFRQWLYSPRPPPADEAVEDEVADLVGRAIGGHALGDAGHLLDEVDQAQIEVIFDQGEARDADARDWRSS